jgi:hypothetical protein
MSKFDELFKKFSPLEAAGRINAHRHSYLRISGVEGYRCNCGDTVSTDAVFEYNISVEEVKFEKQEILELIDEMLLDPPMRGDVALVLLRNKIEKRD